MARISILGAGRMGTACAKALLRAGHEGTVWNRSARPITTGARRVASVREAASAELVIDVVSDYASSASFVRNPEVTEALRGKTLLDLASGTPRALAISMAR